MKYQNNPMLREYLGRGAAGAYREHMKHPSFEVDPAAFAACLDGVREQHPHLAADEACARAVFRLLTSGAPPEIAVALPSRWYQLRAWAYRTAPLVWPWLKLLWAVALLALGIASVLLLSALAANAAPYPEPNPDPRPARARLISRIDASSSELRAIQGALSGWPALAQQPNGLILQLQNGGSVLATRPAGLVILNCSTNMTCSFSGSTFTLTSTGGGGSGCISPGTTTSAILYDSGSGNCGDVSKLTWNSGTSTLSGLSGGTFDYTAATLFKLRTAASATASANGDLAQDSSTGYWHAWVNGHDRLLIGVTNVGVSGQAALSNADGTATFADPIVSGPDATGAASTRNPVQTGALDNGTACSAGPCVRSLILANGAPAGSEYGLIVRPIPNGTQTISGSVNATLQTSTGTDIGKLDANQSVNVAQINGGTTATAATGVQKVGITGNAGAAMDAAGQNATSPANELLIGCQFNTSPTTITSGNVSPEQCDNKGNQLVSVNAALPAGSNVIGHVISDSGSVSNATLQTSTGTDIGKLDANQSVNVAQINGSTTATAATGVQKIGIVGNAGAAVDAATGAAPPANAILHAGLGSGATGGFLIGVPVSDTYKAINISTATTTLIVTGVSGRQIRIGAMHMVTALANNVAWIEGTGATCGTGTAGMAGGTTAASGYNFAANGGIAEGSGFGTVLATVTAGDSVCLVTSAATQLSGGIQYAIY